MTRSRLFDFRHSGAPEALVECRDNIEKLAHWVNAAQQRLLYAKEQSDEGWPGTWAEVAFSVDRCDPYLTTPRGIARLEMIDVAGHPIQLNNAFYEYLRFGNGRMPKCHQGQTFWRNQAQGYTRNNAPLFTDLKDGPQQIQVNALNPLDTQPNAATGETPRVLVQGICKGSPIVTQDNGFTVAGEFVSLSNPSATTLNTFDQITGIQKDVTQGDVQIFQYDPWWGSLQLLSVMEPTETTGWYRRYYLGDLPRTCQSYQRFGDQPGKPGCPSSKREYVLVTALAKLDLIPVVADTDYLLIPNVEALILECQAIRQSRMDNAASRAQSEEYHLQAVRLLIGQQTHLQGKNQPAVAFDPFGSARLSRVNIGMT